MSPVHSRGVALRHQDSRRCAEHQCCNRRRARVRVALLRQLSAGRCRIGTAAYSCMCSYNHAGIKTALEAQASPIAAPNPVFDGQLPSMPSAAMTGSIADPSTPMDIKMGLTDPGDVAHTLRWGFMTAGRICKDMVSTRSRCSLFLV